VDWNPIALECRVEDPPGEDVRHLVGALTGVVVSARPPGFLHKGDGVARRHRLRPPDEPTERASAFAFPDGVMLTDAFRCALGRDASADLHDPAYRSATGQAIRKSQNPQAAGDGVGSKPWPRIPAPTSITRSSIHSIAPAVSGTATRWSSST
jgi:hypothetical protein